MGTRRLPSGKFTTSAGEYSKEWHAISDKIILELLPGYTFAAFDPGLVFEKRVAVPNHIVDKKPGEYHVEDRVELNVCTANAMIESIKRRLTIHLAGFPALRKR
jgi:hypothetical protein